MEFDVCKERCGFFRRYITEQDVQKGHCDVLAEVKKRQDVSGK